MIETIAHSGTNEIKDRIMESQEQYIDRIVEDVIKQAKENLYTLIYSGKVNDEIDLNDVTWNYEIAKAVVNIAIKDVNQKWPSNCHFNSKCKRYEGIIREKLK